MIKIQAKTNSTKQHFLRPVAVKLCVLSLGILTIVNANASSCTNSERDSQTSSANFHTSVHNNTTDTNLRVIIKRGDNVKTDTVIAKGEKASHMASFNSKGFDNKTATIAIVISTEGSSNMSTCKYQATYSSDGVMHWKLVNEEVCKNEILACTHCKISCDKNFHPSKSRWNTTFTVSD